MKTAFAAAAFALALSSVPAAAVTNLNFESGLTGWISTGTTGTAARYGSFRANGTALGYVEAGHRNVYATLTQIFTMAAGETISGLVGFQGNDYLPFNDDAYVKIGTLFARPTTLFSSNIAAVGDYGTTGWQTWSFTAPRAAVYVLQLGVANRLDFGLSSGAVLDVFAPVAGHDSGAVPEPASWALMVAGFGLMGVALRRRQATFA